MDRENQFDITNWLQAWDKEIKKWDIDPFGYYAKHPLSGCYTGKKARAVQPDCLPEPYLGDPLKKHSVIFLNLNPGPTCDNFQGLAGRYTNRVREVGYSEWAKCLPYNPVTNTIDVETVYDNKRHEGGEDFWSNRNRWINEITGYEHGAKDPAPFCLELFPFHSDKWGSLDLEQAKGWLEEWVLKPAVCLVKDAEIPAVMCVGKSFERFFREVMGLAPELSFSSADEHIHENWPLKNTLHPVNRSFSKFRVLGGTFVVTWHSGGNKLPGTIFKQVCQRVIYN
ncbi:hypothetical protein FY034_04530 [Trichlorobacter lovleyi]|uniref:anti-phage DNA glycosylase Brig1 n=1 Tax=Trichlorobacter lovleyi TaxID=313985 RepID=UPI002240A855|nr:hypothetical protein [Trichlorobacter lovleyi]QOX78231.1 hypothetical protein FY034_04530 [Trichlorobacter lovleyi]